MEELESFSDGKHEGSSDESGGVGSLEPRTIDSQNAPPSSRIAIVLPELSKANLETFEDFEDTESNVVECVVGASDQGSKSFLVEFTDGRQVSVSNQFTTSTRTVPPAPAISFYSILDDIFHTRYAIFHGILLFLDSVGRISVEQLP